MPYVSTIERMGIQQGIYQNTQQIIRRMVQGGYDIELISKITDLDKKEIEFIIKNQIMCTEI